MQISDAMTSCIQEHTINDRVASAILEMFMDYKIF